MTAYNWGPVAVIIEEPESISPDHSPKLEGRQPLPVPTSPKERRTSLSSRKLSGRPAPRASVTSLRSAAGLESATDLTSTGPQSSHPGHRQHAEQILSKVRHWLHKEKARASKRKVITHAGHGNHGSATGFVKSLVDQLHSGASDHHYRGHDERHSSDLYQDALALEQLEKILGNDLQLGDDNQTVASGRKPDVGMRKGSRGGVLRKRSTGISSDTDHQDGDIDVPSVEAVLDNSKTLSYTGGAVSSQLDLAGLGRKPRKDADAWIQFKNEIIRLAHTLRLKGWRRVPLDRGADIDVERLSGALTNAVYVVSPPRDLSQLLPSAQDSTTSLTSRKPPMSVHQRSLNKSPADWV